MKTIIDAHIHLDHYKKEEIEPIITYGFNSNSTDRRFF